MEITFEGKKTLISFLGLVLTLFLGYNNWIETETFELLRNVFIGGMAFGGLDKINRK